MQPRRARAIALAAAIAGTGAGTGAGSGCAELAPRVPALTIEAVATERRGVSAGEDSRWSWGVRAGLAGGLGGPGPATEPPTEPPTEPMAERPPDLSGARGSRAPCRVAELCTWEVRARTRALARLRRAVPEEGGR